MEIKMPKGFVVVNFTSELGVKATLEVTDYNNLISQVILRLKKDSEPVKENPGANDIDQEELFSITYLDEDGDRVTISSQEDFDEAVAYFKNEGTDVNLMVREKLIGSVHINQLSHLVFTESSDEIESKEEKIECQNTDEKVCSNEGLMFSEIAPVKKDVQPASLTQSCFDEVSDLTNQMNTDKKEEIKVSKPIEKEDTCIEIKSTKNAQNVPQDYVEDPKVENLEEPKLSQRASSYNSYCESYFDTINELTDVMQGLGVEFDKLSKKICEEEKAEGKSEEPQKNLETSKKLEEQASEEVEEKEQKDELDLLVSDAQSEGEEESKSEIDQPKSSAEIL